MMFNNMTSNCCNHGFGGGHPRVGRFRKGPRGRKARFRSKVREGIQNGTISRQEAHALKTQRQQMRQLKQNAMADGQVTPEEHQQLRAYGQQMRQMLAQFNQA